MDSNSQQQQSIRYVINRHDRIVEISPGWDGFAQENAAPGLASREVLNKSLWEFLSGAETIALYRILVDRVRHTGRNIVVPFRCDGPETRRFMQLEMRPVESGRVEFVSRTEREQERQGIALLEASAPRSERLVTMCGWCKKVKAGPQLWMDTEEAVRTFDLLRQEVVPRLSHGICESCRGNVIQSLRPPTRKVTRLGSTMRYEHEQGASRSSRHPSDSHPPGAAHLHGVPDSMPPTGSSQQS